MIPLLFTCHFTGSRMLPQPSVLHVITWWGVGFLVFVLGGFFFFLKLFKGTQCRLLFLLFKDFICV